jgi:hypothetical protein
MDHDQPLAEDVGPGAAFAERRRHQRVPLRTTVTWRSWMTDRDTWGSAGAVDVSLGGLCMSVQEGPPRPPMVGDVIDLRVPLGDDDGMIGTVETRGLVVAADPAGGSVTCRVAFRTLDDAAERDLTRYCGPSGA